LLGAVIATSGSGESLPVVGTDVSLAEKGEGRELIRIDVHKQLEKEQQARRDCEQSIARQFFSSLAASDPELARQAISNEQAARAQERTLASLATGRKRRKPRAESAP
jgi:hypothetical protein